MMARWLLGLEKYEDSARKTFRMFAAFVAKKGNLSGSEVIRSDITSCNIGDVSHQMMVSLESFCFSSNAEMSWLRLTAGCSMLKIAKQKGVGDQFTAEQFYTLSQLMYVSIGNKNGLAVLLRKFK